MFGNRRWRESFLEELPISGINKLGVVQIDGTTISVDDDGTIHAISDDKKQDKLTAGDGIEILEDGTINNTRVSAEWGNIQGNLSTQTDLQELFSTKVDKQEGKSLINDTEIERLASVNNYDDTAVLSDINNLKVNKQNKLTAGTGIKISEDNIISSTGGSNIIIRKW